LHVTIAYSRRPLDWAKVGQLDDRVVIAAGQGRREVLPMGEDGDCIALRFESMVLSDRWLHILNAGGSWDWPGFHPHITFHYIGDTAAPILSRVHPYYGPIILGPEVVAEIEPGWSENIVQKESRAVAFVAEHSDAILHRLGDLMDKSTRGEFQMLMTKDKVRKVGARNSKTDLAMIQHMHDRAFELQQVARALGAQGKAPAEDSIGSGEDMDAMSDSQFAKRDPRICKIDEGLGMVFGYAIICKVNGEPYYDLNIDKDGSRVPEHIPEGAMLKATADFMQSARAGNEMHRGPDLGQYVFAFPLTTDIAKSMGISTTVTGLMVGFKAPPDVLAKFKSGVYKGFSIEGKRVHVVETD
jgi:hypothetical protein